MQVEPLRGLETRNATVQRRVARALLSEACFAGSPYPRLPRPHRSAGAHARPVSAREGEVDSLDAITVVPRLGFGNNSVQRCCGAVLQVLQGTLPLTQYTDTVVSTVRPDL